MGDMFFIINKGEVWQNICLCIYLFLRRIYVFVVYDVIIMYVVLINFVN